MNRLFPLSGRRGAALSPTGTGLNPTGTRLNPTGKGPRAVGASLNPTGKRWTPINTPSTDGTPPILSEALRSTRAAISRDGDHVIGEPHLPPPPPPIGTPPSSNLWRWDDGVRTDVLRFELLTSVRHSGTTLWSVPLPGQAQPPAIPIIEFKPPPSWEPIVRAQLPLVHQRIEDRDDYPAEILVEEVALWPFWNSVTGMAVERMPNTVELFELALWLASTVALRFKHELACPRPIEVSPAIQPMIDTPGHSSLPSGHAAAGHLFATLMQLMQYGPPSELGAVEIERDPLLTRLRRLAARIADNRVVAGVHYPMDSVAGRLLGETLANHVFALCTGRGNWSRAVFSLADVDVASLAPNTADYNVLGAADGCTQAALTAVTPLPLLTELWASARDEMASFGFRTYDPAAALAKSVKVRNKAAKRAKS